jgi:hypothetical protein
VISYVRSRRCLAGKEPNLPNEIKLGLLAIPYIILSLGSPIWRSNDRFDSIRRKSKKDAISFFDASQAAKA